MWKELRDAVICFFKGHERQEHKDHRGLKWVYCLRCGKVL